VRIARASLQLVEGHAPADRGEPSGRERRPCPRESASRHAPWGSAGSRAVFWCIALPLFELVGPDTSFTSFALFMGVAMSITAFPVLARILVERRMLRHPVGAMAMAAAAVDDATAWGLSALAPAVPGGLAPARGDDRRIGLLRSDADGVRAHMRRHREIIAPKKTKSDEWLDVMRQAHRKGLRTTATMMYGHVEDTDDVLDHFDADAVRPDVRNDLDAGAGGRRDRTPHAGEQREQRRRLEELLHAGGVNDDLRERHLALDPL